MKLHGYTDLAFKQAVNFLASTNDVVVDDLGFYSDADDGTSGVSSNTAAALNNPDNPIRAHVTSPEAQHCDRQGAVRLIEFHRAN